MEQNVGGLDRLVRLVGGTLLVAAGVAGYAGLLWVAYGPLPQALTSVALFVVGAILLVTGLTRRCVVNSLLGVNTRRSGR
jgi:hypothetical protein